MKKAYINWSSGKDAAFALYKIQKGQKFKVEKLVTTINSEVDRVSMHGLRKELLLQQAESLQIPLQIISLNGNVSMQTYNELMKAEVSKLISEGFTHSVFGDIFLEDLKEYRENQLEDVGLKAVFPLWGKNTRELMNEFINEGFKAITVCVNAKLLDKSFCGRIIDHQFIADLPENVDPCGENGEFHSFVFEGPIFKNPVDFEIGEIIEKQFSPGEDEKDDCFTDKIKSWDTRFWYCDLIPKN
jgi:uncharacterized protein (TIGR00290 family)